MKREGAAEIIAPRASAPPKIDGDLSDACWDKTAAVKSFWLGGTAELAEDQTIAWVCFDEWNLYIAFACQDKKVVGAHCEHDTKQIWQNDAVEVYLAPEEDLRRERQFILGIGNSKYDRHAGLGDHKAQVAWNPKPDWEGRIMLQSWGYTAELRIPIAALVDTTKVAVDRGAVWKMKLARLDFGEHANVRLSSWTQIGSSSDDPHAGGDLVFEDRNLLANGGAETEQADGSPAGWEAPVTGASQAGLAQTTEPRTEGSHAAKIVVSGGKGGGYRVLFGALPSLTRPTETTYFFSADIKVESANETLVAYVVVPHADKPEQINLKYNAGWQKVKAALTVEAGKSPEVPFLQGAAVSGNHQKDSGGGTICVDNVRFEVGNLAELGADLDSSCLTGNATGPWHTRNQRVNGTYAYTEPMTTAAEFPNWLRGEQPPEPFAYAGAIPFMAGKLTDGLTATGVQWSLYWTGPLGHDITFDLGAECLITRVELVGLNNVGFDSLWLKSPGESRYTLVGDKHDLIAFDSGIVTRQFDDATSFDNVNQSARWVRVQHRAKVRELNEVRIWGKPFPKDKPVTRKPYLLANGATPISKPKSEPIVYGNIPPVFPEPQEMKLVGEALPLQNGMVIAYEPADSARAKATAEVLRDEMRECFGLTMEVKPATEAGNADISIGEYKSDKPLPPEGYVLNADGKRVVIHGRDAQGAFYGTQSLLSLTRRSKNGGWEVTGAIIRDWPDMPIRYIQGRPVPEKNLIRALARFRINYYEPQYRHLAEAAQWDKEAERYFVSFVPALDFNTVVLQRDPNLVERTPGEKPEDLGVGRRNANPNHSKTWEIYFSECDKWLPQFHGKFVNLSWDETYQIQGGARWNVSAESRALNLTAWQLLAHTLNRIEKKLKEYGKSIIMQDTAFMGHHRLSYPGDPDPDWNKALDHLPKDTTFLVWHPKEVNELLKSKGFAQLDFVLDETDWRKRNLPGPYQGVIAYMAESAFTPNKLLELAGIAWNTKAIRPQDPQASLIVSHAIPLWNALHKEQRLPSLYATKEDFVPLDIAKAANRSRLDDAPYDGKGWVDMGANVDLRALPSGAQEMAGIPFRILDEKKNGGNSIVMVQNRGCVDRTMPSEVEIEMGNTRAASLIFLHCLDNRPGHNYLRRKELAGFYFIEYDDGTYAKKEIKYAVNTANWDGRHVNSGYNPKGHNMTDGQLVWQGDTTSGLKAYLYSTEWVNPKPDKPIRKILFRTAYSLSNMNPMLFAITAVKSQLATPNDKPAALPSSAQLAPMKPVGTLLDLRGGKDESESRYVAPDGTIIHAEVNNTLADHIRWDVIEYRSFVGMANQDSNKSVRANTLEYTFPQPTAMRGALVTAASRMERKAENFSPAVYDVFLELSDDGKTWRVESSIKNTSPEEHGPVWLAVQTTSVQKARIRVEPKSDTCTGIANVQWFKR
ncbi:MAG: hypothetical protein HY360_05945 [Verrucomicrobia bacterium]|nr:hypothetical protein [Verrucomicrobiota bacterium]